MEAEGASSQGLTVSGLGCLRGGKVLFRDLSFQLAPGHMLVVKGANGSGKTTLLRSLAGLLPWCAGVLHWNGQCVQPSDAVYGQQVAYLGHHCGVSHAMTGLENLRFGLSLMDVRWEAERVQQALQHWGLTDAAEHAVARMSQGQQRRLGLARVQLSARTLWLLDEPDNSLDDAGCQRLGDALRRHLDAGGMAVAVSHRGLQMPADHQHVLELQSAPRTHSARRVEVAPC